MLLRIATVSAWLLSHKSLVGASRSLSIFDRISARMGSKMTVDSFKNEPAAPTVVKSDEEWRKELPANVYQVARNNGTERAWTSPLLEAKNGTFNCACCGNLLFAASTKFESGSGWPSYFEPATPDSVRHLTDHEHGMVRTEVRCKKCEAHLGHVFNDGPKPTGLRYCINGVCLLHKPDQK